MPFFRIGKPGEDTWAHLNMGRHGHLPACTSPAHPDDDHSIGKICARRSVALCDHPRCDAPICELHQTKHPTKPNTDFCPLHKEDAGL